MSDHHLKKPGPAALLAGTLLTVLLVGSCGNETPTMCPIEGLGVLEGYVFAAGQGVSAEISARAEEGPNPGWTTHRTVSDSTGWYRLELPSGLYELNVVPADGSSGFSNFYDTIRVLPRVFRFDLHRGYAEVRVDLPEELEDQSFHLYLRNDDQNSMSDNSRVENGTLVFEFPLIWPDAYSMELSGGDLAARMYLPHEVNRDDADRLLVSTEAVTRYHIDFTDTYATISGSITGSWQESGSNSRPEFEFYSQDNRRIGRKGISADGSFTCGFLVPQAVLLQSEHRNVRQWFGGDSFETATVFELEPGDRIGGVTLIESGIKVGLDGPGDLVFHRAEITVRDEAGVLYSPYTNWNNPVDICNLRPGRYYLHVDGFCEDQVWAPQWYGGSESLEEAVPIDLAEGELRSFTLDLVEGGRIEGNLLRADGTRPRWVDFGLFDSEGQEMCSGYSQWREFNEGRFGFQGLANGQYYLAVYVTNSQTWWYPGTFEFAEAVPIAVVDHAAVTAVDWRLP